MYTSKKQIVENYVLNQISQNIHELKQKAQNQSNHTKTQIIDRLYDPINYFYTDQLAQDFVGHGFSEGENKVNENIEKMYGARKPKTLKSIINKKISYLCQYPFKATVTVLENSPSKDMYFSSSGIEKTKTIT